MTNYLNCQAYLFKLEPPQLIRGDDFFPLAAARNKAATMATGDKLVFLDVDCIAQPELVGSFDHHLEQEDALYQGSVRYLNADWQVEGWTYSSLAQDSDFNRLQGKTVNNRHKIPHPYELFWSLCFGISKQTFLQLGGFDDNYTGYGGEDTDFAFTARSHQLPLYKVSALAYHQFHPAYSPPLNHLVEIVNNARVFERKWQILPMDKWLEQLQRGGYITLQANQIEIIKHPTESAIRSCLKNS